MDNPATNTEQKMTTVSVSNTPFKLSSLLLAVRPRTLPASISPVILGSCIAFNESFSFLLFICACAVAFFLQIAVNLANDVFDAKSGVDTSARLGPIRVTQSGLLSANTVVLGIAVFVVLATLFGLVLVLHTGWILLVAGILCILATLAYSAGPFPLASHGLGEITVLLFFGWVAVLGSYYVQTQQLSWQVFFLANALGLILAAIMLVNNLRDIRTDKAANKITLAVYLGDSGSRLLYKTLLMGAVFFHCLAFLFFPAQSKYMVTFAPILICLPMGFHCLYKAKHTQGKALNKLLAETAILGLIYSVSTAASYYLDLLL